MVHIEDETLRLDTVCQPLQYHPGASVTQVVGTTNFPPSFAAAGYASCFKGFGPAPGTAAADGVAFVQRADVTPKKPEGAAQHVALFKNVLVAADGGTSAKLHVYDVRDWSVKQVIRVGQVAEAAPRRGDDDGDDDDASRSGAPAPASVSALAFDGMTIAAGTHQGYVHTWKLMEHEGKRGYVRLLNPLKVDSLPVTKVHLSTDAQLLSAYSPTKRTLVVWELITVVRTRAPYAAGKLKSAYTVDAVAHGVPMRLTANCESVIACVHAHPPPPRRGQEDGERAVSPPLAALLDVNSGEGGSVRDVAVLQDEGDPMCVAFDGELLAVGTSSGAVVAWNVAEGYAAWKGYHGGAVAALASVPGEPARLVSGSADRSVLLWDREGRVQARLELGAAVTALSSPTPRSAVAGTAAGTVELLALCDADADHDEALTAAAKAGRKRGNERIAYAWKHDAAGAAAAYTSFDDFTRRVPVKEGPMPSGGTGDAAAGAEGAGKGSSEAEKAMAKGMMRGLRASASEEESEEAVAARKKKEDEVEKAKHRAMDAAGVARNPDVRATLDGVRKCSNPTCVEREDTIAGRMLRCSRCKEALYCSGHCQRTHWRDGHKGKCKPAAAAEVEVEVDEKEKETEKEKEKEKEKMRKNPPPSLASAPAPVPAPTPAISTPAPTPAAPTSTSAAPPRRRALVVEDDSEDDEDEGEEEGEEVGAIPQPPPPPTPPSAKPVAAPAPVQRRALVVEEDSDEDDSDDETATTKAPKQSVPAMKRHALVIEDDADTDAEDDADADAEDDDSGDDDDEDTPALPPWMTVNKPPAPPTPGAKTRGGGVAGHRQRGGVATEEAKPPSAKAREEEGERGTASAAAAPPPPHPSGYGPLVAVDPVLEPMGTDDLLYDLD